MLSKRLRTREIDGRDCKRHCARQRFSHFKLQQSHDTHDPDAANLRLSFLRRRSKIVEIVSGGDIVFALTLSGVCAAFRGKKRLAFLNTTPDEVIRSLFFNKTSQSVITVSVYREDNFASLKCRNTRTPAHTHAQRVRASLSLSYSKTVCACALLYAQPSSTYGAGSRTRASPYLRPNASSGPVLSSLTTSMVRCSPILRRTMSIR